MLYFVAHHFLFFLNSKTNAVTNLNPLSSEYKSLHLFLNPNFVFLSCSSGSKEFKISTL